MQTGYVGDSTRNAQHDHRGRDGTRQEKQGRVTASVHSMEPLAGAQGRKLCPQDCYFGIKYSVLKAGLERQLMAL